MHVAGIARETFSGFGHEAGSDAEFAAQGFDDVSEQFLAGREALIGFENDGLEQPSFIRHLLDLSKLEGLVKS